MQLNKFVSFADRKINKMKSELNKLPDDELLRIEEICEYLKIGTSAVRDLNLALKEFTQIISNGRITRYWGNKKTIAKLRKGQSNLCR